MHKIYNACRDGDVERVRLLFAETKGPENDDDDNDDNDDEDDYDDTGNRIKNKYLLHVAAANGHADVVKFLIENGEDVNRTDGTGCTALSKGLLCTFCGNCYAPKTNYKGHYTFICLPYLQFYLISAY